MTIWIERCNWQGRHRSQPSLSDTARHKKSSTTAGPAFKNPELANFAPDLPTASGKPSSCFMDAQNSSDLDSAGVSSIDLIIIDLIISRVECSQGMREISESLTPTHTHTVRPTDPDPTNAHRQAWVLDAMGRIDEVRWAIANARWTTNR